MATGETTLSSGHDRAEDESRALIHDFRNLLAVIINYSELIAEETDDPEAVKADIGEVRAAAERALVLTEKLPRALIHDFRTPLAVIVNYSELIAEETDDPEAVKADIGEVRAAGERAIVLTEKLPRGPQHAAEPEPHASSS